MLWEDMILNGKSIEVTDEQIQHSVTSLYAQSKVS